MSPSAVESFAMMNEFDTELDYYSIGETTANTLRKKGVQKINTATKLPLKPCSNNTQHKTNKKWSSQN